MPGRGYHGLPEFDYPFTTRPLRSQRGRICYKRKKNLSLVFAGQAVGIKRVEDHIWLASFMDYNLRYIDLEQRTLQTIDNPFGTRLPPMSQEQTVTYIWYEQSAIWRAGEDETENRYNLAAAL
ncbi:hypothetical protein [Rhizobium leucaenae]|uniref:Uncharacterized protein n=1 Tax=Rhizobium leucaenae TaxID=29450 RepID=A0A7W7EHW7_9HYPH|nr:hypothetical protein [Rhizobium leucaenae]MBB4566131.1 hypothetical protein [Rhizobium leucaenae]MBB6302242.1 hypothetical protein [Rhizobium leucaenae]